MTRSLPALLPAAVAAFLAPAAAALPENPLAQHHAAEALFALGRTAEARAAYARVGFTEVGMFATVLLD